MHQIAVPNGTIGVFAQGRGEPILFVHGFPLRHDMWRSQIEAFGKSYRVIAPDLRGFGESKLSGATATTTLTMEAFADDLHVLLHAVFVDRPVVLCGLSMGGYIAWQFLRKYRDQLKALVLCDTRATGDSPEQAAGRQKLAAEVLALGPQAAVDAMLPRLVSPKTAEQQPGVVSDLRKMILRNSSVSIAATLRGLAERPDCTQMLPSIDVPTLVLCGQDDQITPMAEMKTMAQAIPGAQFVEVADAGHMSPMENPKTINATIDRFLKSI
jgi:pimeloyl-ACP methyl ester carboxylesterase